MWCLVVKFLAFLTIRVGKLPYSLLMEFANNEN
uniref:Uncharacterized protein n=1 Tax=Arundo donax TaxID=35708 RepID=A0A0A8ZBC9_ARUDO